MTGAVKNQGIPGKVDPCMLLSFVGRSPAAVAVGVLTWCRDWTNTKVHLLVTADRDSAALYDRIETLLRHHGVQVSPLSIRDPKAAAEAITSQLNLHDKRIVLLVDPGFGYAVAKLARDLADTDPVLVSASDHELSVQVGAQVQTLELVDLTLRPLLCLYNMEPVWKPDRARAVLQPKDLDSRYRPKEGLVLKDPTTGKEILLDLAWEQHGRLYGRKVVLVREKGDTAKAREPGIVLATGVLANLHPHVTLVADTSCIEDATKRVKRRDLILAEARSANLGALALEDAGTENDIVMPPGGSLEVPAVDLSVGINGRGWDGDPAAMWLGSDPSATLAALYTHKPSCSHLLVDKAVAMVRAAVLGLRTLAEKHPGEIGGRIEFHDVHPSGGTLASLLAGPLKDVAVHVTPGTKRQRAAVARFSSSPLWSLDRERKQSECLTHPDRRRQLEPVPLLPQLFVASALRDPGLDALTWTAADVNFHVTLAERLVEEFRARERQGEPTDLPLSNLWTASEPGGPLHGVLTVIKRPADNVSFTRKGTTVTGTIRRTPKDNLTQGDWLSDVAAACLANQLRTSAEVRVNVDLNYRDRADQMRTDADLAARIDHDFFWFDAKAGVLPALTDHRWDAVAKARMFGRFCVPIALRPWILPQQRKDFQSPVVGAAVLDLEGLTSPGLRRRLLQLVDSRRKAAGIRDEE